MAGLNDLADDSKLKVPGLERAISGGTNRELMADARAALSGNWGLAIVGYVLYVLLLMSFLSFLLASIFFAGTSAAGSVDEFVSRVMVWNPAVLIVQFLINGAFIVGFMGFFLGIAQEGEAHLENLFVGFRRFWQSLGVYLFSSLFIFLWSLLLVIPGIIAAFQYAMVYFIIADDEDCGPLEAINRSREMMKGNKWKFFCLNLRFIGWSILAAIPCGLGFLWLVPYMQTSFAKFYEDVS